MIEQFEIPYWITSCQEHLAVHRKGSNFVVKCEYPDDCWARCPGTTLPFDPRRIVDFTRVCNVYDTDDYADGIILTSGKPIIAMNLMGKNFVQRRLQKYALDAQLWYWFTAFSCDMDTLFVFRLKGGDS